MDKARLPKKLHREGERCKGQGWKYRLVIGNRYYIFAFLLSIIADALRSLFSIHYRLFCAFCLHFIDW